MALIPISLTIEETRFIPVLRVLNALPGVADVHWDLDKLNPKRKPKADKPNGGGAPVERAEGGLRMVLMGFLFQNGPQHLAALKELLDQKGFAASSIHSALNELRNAGATESGGPGIHKLTEKAMAAMQPQEPPRRALPPPTPTKRPKVWAILMRGLQASPLGRLSRDELSASLETMGLAGRSLDDVAYNLRSDGLLKPVNPAAKGVYELTAKGRKLQLPPAS